MLLCPRCQKRNPDRTALCHYCGASMAGAAAWGGSGAPQAAVPPSSGGTGPTSGMATTSLVLGILGLFSFGLLALAGLILGIVSLGQIDRSEGRLQGRGVAIGGIVVSALTLAVMFLIVPITAAILFPVFAQARERARAMVCISHLRHVGSAMLMYADDYDGHLPRRENWCDAVLPYVRSPQDNPPQRVFSCPSLADQPSGQAYNAQLSALSVARIASPFATAEIYDARGGWNLAGGADLAAPRHNDGLYLLFVDAHVKWMQSLNSVVWKPAASTASPARRATVRHRRGRRHRR
jgi:prepilin-type processing-associated H-X9-DG protein